MTVTHKKAAQILKNWNLEQETITDIYYEGTGDKNENACYVGENYVLKYTCNLGKAKKHLELSDALAQAGLLSAMAVETADGQRYVRDGEIYFYLTRRLPGKQLISHHFDEAQARFVGEIIGQLHRALEQVDDCAAEADLLVTIRDWALPKAQDALGLSDGFCKDYLDTFTALYPGLPRHIIHRDPNPSNMICQEDRWGFIDFELAERNARIYDPCYAATAVLSETFEESRESWLALYRQIMAGYDSVAHMTQQERQAVPYVILANQFVCVAWFAQQEQYAQLFETNKAMTAWLIQRLDTLRDI